MARFFAPVRIWLSIFQTILLWFTNAEGGIIPNAAPSTEDNNIIHRSRELMYDEVVIHDASQVFLFALLLAALRRALLTLWIDR
jgi:hypothetical protein